MKKLNTLIILLLLAGSGIAFTIGISRETTIYIVRHGEKESSDLKNQDPNLSKEGKERAEALALVLKDVKIDAAFATKYKRTSQTILPSLIKNRIQIQLYEAHDFQGLANVIKSKYNNRTVLVGGHSNTVLEILEALGAKRPVPEIDDEDYDFLFEIKIDRFGKVILHTHRYGTEHHKTLLK